MIHVRFDQIGTSKSDKQLSFLHCTRLVPVNSTLYSLEMMKMQKTLSSEDPSPL